MAKEKNDELVEEIKEFRRKYKNGRHLFNMLSSELNNNEFSSHDELSEFDRARNFFILNRISFSGLAISGGFSKESFKKRFTKSSIERLNLIKGILKDVEITHGDYSNLLDGSQKGVFIYFDPPYLSTKGSKLYGQNGKYHTNFDHDKFLKAVIKCRHNWLITYDYTKETKRKFQNFDNICLVSLKFQYSMKSVSKDSNPKRREYIITNYKVKKISELRAFK